MPTYIKSLVMHGFKSFARRVEVPFDRTLNVIVGPNGSGKSNVTEAICFVLGRLSAKSLRAERSSSLIYNGGKSGSPSDSAIVEMVFDNSERIFSVENPEVKISRIVGKGGNSVYKINDETKTRQEVLELLSQGGIDPNGFNIILQEEISKFVEMHPEERRRIIEEVAGISIYEERKHKSLLELERTDEKFKEVNTILHERTSYLKNLDQERNQALKHERIKQEIKRDKATLLFRQLEEKKKENNDLIKKINEKEEDIGRLRVKISEYEDKIKAINLEINSINETIEQSTGVRQDQLHSEISDIRADIAGLSVKFENLNQQITSNISRKEQLELEIKRFTDEIIQLKESMPKDDLKKILKSKTEVFSSIEEEKDRLDKLKTEQLQIKIELEHKRSNYDYLVSRINLVQEKISDLEKVVSKDTDKLDSVIAKIERSNAQIKSIEKEILSSHNKIAEFKKEISLIDKMKKDIADLDVCPVCKRKVTPDHVREFHSDSDSDIARIAAKMEKEVKLLEENENIINKLKTEIISLNEKANKLKINQLNEASLNEKKKEKEQLEKELHILSDSIKALEKRFSSLNLDVSKYKDVEAEYYQLREELKDITKKTDSLSSIQNDILLRERDIEQMKVIIKRGIVEKKELEQSLEEIKEQLSAKQKIMAEKEKQDKKIRDEFQKLLKKKASLQEEIREIEEKLMNDRLNLRSLEDEYNIYKLAKAKADAELETYANEFEQYKDLDIESLKLKQSRAEIEERIKRNEIEVARIGPVNLRALEVYDSVKEEYDKVFVKVQQLEVEKQEILNVIAEIDKKKRKSFMKVLEDVNRGFSGYFLKLGGREAYLKLENEDDPFAGGVDIEVKLGKGKYLDVSSLSGGERTLVALSLIFAIQELRPYCFYIFDEIDAALDKRNSERLAGLLKTYMKNAQYIVITHNDSLITEANALYGVSMQDGVSKVLSLKV